MIRVWILLAALASTSLAQAASTVAILRAADPPELLRKAQLLLAAELRASGFDVAETPLGASGDLRGALETAAPDRHPIASITLVSAGVTRVDVWIADRVTGKMLVRALLADSPNIDIAASDLALRAVELLRGSLLELRFEPARAAPAVDRPPADVARFVDAAEPLGGHPFRSYALQGLGVGVAAAVMKNLGGLEPTWAPTARLSYGRGSGFALRVAFAGPSAAHEFLADGGTARLRQMLFTAEALWFFRPEDVVQPFAKTGLGLARLQVDGKGISDLFPSRSPRALVPFAQVGGGLALRLGRSVSVMIETEVLLPKESYRITVADQFVGRVGPSFVTSVGAASAF